MSKIGKVISKAWGVDQSAIDSTPKISYVCGGELFVENHGGIEKITPNEVNFFCGITVSGKNLAVEWVEKALVSVSGDVYNVNCENYFL